MRRLPSLDPSADVLATLFSPPAEADEEVQRVLARIRHAVSSACARAGVYGEPAVNGDGPARRPDVVIPSDPMGLAEYSVEFLEPLIEASANLSSPRCLGHMSGTLGAFVHALAEVVSRLDQNLVKRDASRAFTRLERDVLALLHRAVYAAPEAFYDAHLETSDGALGCVCSGATLANVTALWCARNRFLHGAERAGVAAALDASRAAGAVVIASRLAHYSIEKAAGLLGLGRDAVLRLPVDRRGRVIVDALEEVVAECGRRGRRVIAIVGVAGTTDAGTIDPLACMADIASRAGIHFHVDAAWGAPMLFSPALRGRLAGIERADSVAIDGHKQLFAPLGTSALILRDTSLGDTIAMEAPYMLRPDSGDLGRASVEGSRPAAALYLHAALHLIGARGFDEALRTTHERAREMAEAVAESAAFELLCEPETNIVLYRFLPEALRSGARAGTLGEADLAAIDRCNARLQDQQSRRGVSYVSHTLLGCLHPYGDREIVALRAVVANPRTGLDDIALVLEEQEWIGARIATGGRRAP